MNKERFEQLLDELDGNSLQTLKTKGPKYAPGGDVLYNFKAGADIMNTTTAGACWNYMAKHLADLRGKIERNDFSDREDLLEKCQDTINYIRFLWVIGNEQEGHDLPTHEYKYIPYDIAKEMFGDDLNKVHITKIEKENK